MLAAPWAIGLQVSKSQLAVLATSELDAPARSAIAAAMPSDTAKPYDFEAVEGSDAHMSKRDQVVK